MDNKKTDDVEAHGFNDDELADIMSEIEDLEKDLSDDSALKVAKAEVASVKSAPKEESKDVLLKLADMPEEKAIKTSPVKSSEASIPSSASKMEFCVAGNMAVNLTFHVGGESVCIVVDEAQGLVIEMNGGAKFTLPLSGCAKGKKVA